MAQTVRIERMESAVLPIQDRLAQRFPTVKDPGKDTGHRVTYALEKKPEGGASIDVVMEFRQGYVNDDNLGDLLMEWPHRDIGDEKTFAHVIPKSVAKSIVDYSDLWLCMVSNQR